MLELLLPGERFKSDSRNHELDIRDRCGVLKLFEELRPDAVVHAHAQPSHDFMASRPFDDFDVNAVGTLNLLGKRAAVRHRNRPSSICRPTRFMATRRTSCRNSGEPETRWEYARAEDYPRHPRGSSASIARSTRIFGASACAADVMAQEYGRYFGMRTCCLRGGWSSMGPAPFGRGTAWALSYLVKVNVCGGHYKVFGYQGKQVRDNIHSHDVACFIERFIAAPRCGEVYNLGGGREKLDARSWKPFQRVEADHRQEDELRVRR